MALHLTLHGTMHSIEIVRRKPLTLRVDGVDYRVGDLSAGAIGSLDVDDVDTAFARALVDEAREICFVRMDGRTHEVELIDPREESAGHDATRDEIHAPMPGAVISLHKAPGDPVVRGETIVTIESMKLQTALVAPRDGRLLAVLKGQGETFDKDELLARLAPADEE